MDVNGALQYAGIDLGNTHPHVASHVTDFINQFKAGAKPEDLLNNWNGYVAQNPTRNWGYDPRQVTDFLYGLAASPQNGPLNDGIANWSRAAPSLSPRLLLGLAQSGVSPTDPTGQWLVRTAVPALSSKKPMTGNLTESDAVANLLADPAALANLKAMPLDQQTNVFKQSAGQYGALTYNQQIHLAQTGHADPSHGFLNHLGDWATTALRETGAGLASGAQAIGAAFRARSGMGSLDPTAEGVHETAKGTPHETLNAAFERPRFGQTIDTGFGKLAYGTPQQTITPAAIANQTDLGQQLLHNKSLGGGFFPSGPAHEAQAHAAQLAANINGHALTPGRALASTVATPGSMPYKMMSGAVDFGVAMEADPGATLLQELTGAAKGARLFSPTSEEALNSAADHIVQTAGASDKASEHMTGLREWTGTSSLGEMAPDLKASVVDKLRAEPGSLSELEAKGIVTHKDVLAAVGYPSAGVLQGLRNTVSSQNALQFLNSNLGQKIANKMAEKNGFDIWTHSNKNIPVDVAWKLGSARTSEDVTRIIGQHIGADIVNVPYKAKFPFHDLRLFAHMPNYAVDAEDPEAMVQRALQELQMGKVPAKEWDGMLGPLALAQDKTDALNGFRTIGNRIGENVLAKTPGYQKAADRLTGLEAEFAKTDVVTSELTAARRAVRQMQGSARDLTTYFTKNNEEDRQWWLTATGDTPYVPGLSVDGGAMPIHDPYLASEFLNRGIPHIGGDGTEGIRAVRRAVSAFSPLWQQPIVGGGAKGLTYVADHLTGLWKTGLLLKAALPLRFLADEQARMATEGYTSAFHNPASYIAWAMGSRGEGDVLGEKFVEQMRDYTSSVQRAMGLTSSWRGALFDSDKIYGKGWGTFAVGHKMYPETWANRLSAMHQDDVAQEFARAIADPAYVTPGVTGDLAGVDAVKQSFWDGPLAKTRQDLVKANLKWGSANLVDRAQADAYIDGVGQRIQDLTGNHPDLVNAVGKGTPFQLGDVDRKFLKQLGDLQYEGVGPDKVIGRVPFDADQATPYMKRATNAAFSMLMGAPTGKLTRSPAFRQAYWQRIDSLLPYMDDASRAKAIEQAAKVGVQLEHTTAVDALATKVTLDQADTLAKGHALKTVHDSLYFPGERTNLEDNLRNIIPFASAWKNVISTWAKLAAENPVVYRRVQQGVTSLRDSGFFYQGRLNGSDQTQELFSLVPADAMKHLAGVPFPMAAPVRGLNIAGQGLPGVGPAVEMGADQVLRHFSGPIEQDVRKWLTPFGSPDYSGGFFESFFPGWLDKIRTSGYLGFVPGLGQTANKSRILGDLAKQVFDYKVSASHVDLNDADAMNKLMHDSMEDAKKLYLFRGLAQFASPSAPNYTSEMRTKDGGTIELYKMVDRYRQLVNANNGDQNKATLQFVQEMGPHAIFATEPANKRTVFGIPTTAEGEIWKWNHQAFAEKNPDVFGYWVPSQGAFSYQAYNDAIQRGEIKPLKMSEWATLAEARLGNAIYDHYRQMMPPSPSKQAYDILDNIRQQISDLYPGFAYQDSAKPGNLRTPEMVRQLRQAIADPAVRDTGIAKAAQAYIHYRDLALSHLDDKYGHVPHEIPSSAKYEPLRAKLYEIGTRLATVYPEWTTMWNNVFQDEVQVPNAQMPVSDAAQEASDMTNG